MHIQAQIREGKLQATDFRMDYWEMQRAKAALIQYLEFIEMVAELPLVDMSSGQPKAVRQPGSSAASSASSREQQSNQGHHHHQHYHHLHHDSRYFNDAHSEFDPDSDNESFDSTGPMDMASEHSREAYREQGSKYAWAGTKAPILTILATLLQPPNGRSTPGNPDVQRQILQYNGLSTLLNCVAYDGYQPLSRERVTLCLKWLVEGNNDAAEWFKELFKHTEAAGKSGAPDLARETRETREVASDVQKQRRAALAAQSAAAAGPSVAPQPPRHIRPS
ncbi:unnamed protein product [Parascedosporium putredinis]|uniref:Ataxin-10 homolog n=1 Tax=Parascedosporium putredinis TaxID=1442378 RepID=A0A9P1H646_9PEZI|nr:unnamed protein product [Parascedosporium putredinis]CAI7999941.1 unnamed protein product [Parascedosporium putredinis]